MEERRRGLGKREVKTSNLHQRRYTFLCALRYGSIPFWQSLNEDVWKSRGVERLDRLPVWLAHWGIVNDWLVDDAIIPTLKEWDKDPSLGNARLEPGYRWFFYRPPGDGISPFLLADGTAALPRVCGPLNADDVMRRGSAEQRQQVREVVRFEGGSLNDMLPRFFERIERDYHEVRRRGSHHAAWVEHKRYLRALAETNRNLVLHAEWTALVWVDVPTSEIARRWRHPRLPRWGQPDKLVSMAVRRFADSIGLTLVN